MGSDGLFDNLEDEEIVKTVNSYIYQKIPNIVQISKKLANLAFNKS